MLELEIFDAAGQPFTRAHRVNPPPANGSMIEAWLESLTNANWGMRARIQVHAVELDDWLLGNVVVMDASGQQLGRGRPFLVRHGAQEDLHPTSVTQFQVPQMVTPVGHLSQAKYRWEGWHLTIRGIGS